MPLVNCPQFCVGLYDLDEPMTIDYSDLDSFVILVCVDGEGTVVDDEGGETSMCAGDTLLIPAVTAGIYVSGTLKFLEAYV